MNKTLFKSIREYKKQSLLLGEENVREACLFPRDLNRLEP